ncbi:TetR/AcrR family transcriptional regulator [Ramlibacter montanisoli]|uniref:TetR/AcrR family transcriptional regulator n=1 Tax=Ramlibacter montanisoli TaxID=2732512 RepID=A0A849KAM7_9BURK|nr:TetR/AcrR family transcriptional regulator [Ramlibacter montanisoli]NNU45382.1 TetR/AcrR family transcriptional regulator [Ramlibacter montanisoli]
MDKSPVQGRPTARRGPHAPGKAPRADGASTRALILEAARRRLVEGGYANLNVREIAADAGVNHALIGYHFHGKQQLVLAVLDEANNRLLERQGRMYDASATASDKWRQACDFYDDDLRSGFVKLLMELMGASFHDPELRREFTPRMLAWHRLIEEEVAEFIRASGLKLPVSARAISAWIGWFWMGMEASMALDIPEEEGHQREALQAVATLLRHVERGTAARRESSRRRK